jgi:hypothetical protein
MSSLRFVVVLAIRMGCALACLLWLRPANAALDTGTGAEGIYKCDTGTCTLASGTHEDAEPPPIAPARRPPFFTSPALRRRLGELDEIQGDSRRQMDMFDA